MMKRKLLSLALSLAMVLSLAACTQAPVESTPTPTPTAPAGTPAPPPTPTPDAGPETASFTDSLGRTVELPAELTRIAPSGPLAQMVLFALAPDLLVGTAAAWSEEAKPYIDEAYYDLPVLGQLYGASAGELNLETLAAANPQVVIDIGEPKKSAAGDMDDITGQLGIPAVHIDAYTATMGDAYRALGALLGLEEEAETLASYCDEIYGNTTAMMDAVGPEGKVKVLYCVGDKGLNVIAKGAYQGELIDLMCENVAVVEEPSAKGSGNEVDMEQILLWDPDVIFFAPSGMEKSATAYAAAGDDPVWQELKAIQNHSYYEVPYGPYNWMGFPPSVNRYLGMLWLGTLLYPEQAEYDLYTEAARYYKLFYHTDLTHAQFEVLTDESVGN